MPVTKEYKVGIVGGSGFIGSALARHLLKRFKVKVLDRKPPPKCIGDIEFSECDIRRYAEVERNLKDVNLVIHMAIIQIPLINEAKRLGYEANVLGTQNVCEVADRNPLIKGLILGGSWHVFGEMGLKGVINEEFSFRPDKVEDRARIYALSKIAQETIVRLYDEMSEKIYGIIRMGTVLGEAMPEKVAANIFISRGLRGETIIPYKHSMYRPMLYVDINDVRRAFEAYALRIFSGKIRKDGGSSPHIVNLCWPKPVTILELASIVKDAIVNGSNNRIKPEIEIVDKGLSSPYTERDVELIAVDSRKAKRFLGLKKLTNPKEAIERIVRTRMELVSNKEGAIEE